MGYSHYYYTPKTFPKTKFKAFTEDVKKIVNYSQNKLGIKLGDGMGENEPIIEDGMIWLNGSVKQPKGMWTTSEQVGLSWPSDTAGIIDGLEPVATEKWFAGDLLNTRIAQIYNLDPNFADGSYETFMLERIKILDKWDKAENGLYFNSVKTNYCPYDLVVTACLIALKHHFPQCQIKSDGKDKDWIDGKMMCNNILGYGMNFELDK